MPPSPSSRCSPQRGVRMENDHKRGHIFESGSPVKTKDDDLALFNDMQMQERDNSLLHSTDHSENSSYFKLKIPFRGESSELLSVDSEENDYDWLLTPPDTPLFPSLDDDEPAPVNLVSRSRAPTRPITISRPSMTGKSHRASRSSDSPCQLSPSPRSGSNMPQSGRRPSYARHSSPTPVSRPATPSRGPASPPIKSSTPTARSPTLNFRRMSTGSSGSITSSPRKGASPVKASRANSSSPKLRGWQTNLPLFSSEPPPNHQISISDRPVLHERGSSPSYGNKGDSSLRSGRQSLVPTSSRSVSSSHNHDRDRFRSHSKGSIASSGDDDADSLYSVNSGNSASPALRENGGFANSRNMMFSQKPSRTLTASSAPKRSFNSDVREVDQHKSSQSTFRPLFSSVPASTFYVGKANTMHHPVFSRNSSLTSSSNASSELGTSVVVDTEINEHDQNDIVGEWEKMPDAVAQEEIFAFDKKDEIVNIGNEICIVKLQNILGDLGGSFERTMESDELEQLTSGLVDIAVTLPTSEFSPASGCHSDVDSVAINVICFKCNKSFRAFETTDAKVDVCQQCAEKDGSASYGMYAAGLPQTMIHVSHHPDLCPNMAVMVDKSCEKSLIEINVPEVAKETRSGECQSSAEKGHVCFPDISPIKLVTSKREEHLPVKVPECEPEVVSTSCSGGGNFQQFHSLISNQKLIIDCAEGAGISVLLKRSNSSKESIVQGRALTAARILSLVPSETRDNVNALKVSATQGMSSAPSSVDLGSLRQSEARAHRQLGSSKTDMGCVRNEPGLSSQNTEAFLPKTLNNFHEDLIHIKVSYAKDNVNALQDCVTWERSSASSSIDLGSSRQTEAGIQRQLTCSNNGMECVRTDLSLKTQSAKTFLSEGSCNSQEDLSPPHVDRSKEKVDGSAEVLLHGIHGESTVVTEEHVQSLEKAEPCGTHSSFITAFISAGDEIIHGDSCRKLDSSCTVSEMQNTLLGSMSTSDISDERHVSYVNFEAHLSQIMSAAEEVMPGKIWDSYQTEEVEIINTSPCRISISETLSQSSSGTPAVLEDENNSFEGSKMENESSQSMSNIVESSNSHSISPTLEDVLISSLESRKIYHVHDIQVQGETAITVEGPGGNKSRFLTLEEATDTILFCSSIIHDLAFKAATIGMEKECSSPEQAYQPAVVAFGKSTFNEKDQKETPSRHAVNSLNARRKMLEMDANIPVAEPENNMKIDQLPTSNTEFPNKAGSIKPWKLESKCNCTVM
uniref:Uncharacterized protein n=1 Tax=Anthurium amnicola TaxID=1678845 RepID=A0A1D1XE50_9ARAE